jgi:hypothetical protein
MGSRIYQLYKIMFYHPYIDINSYYYYYIIIIIIKIKIKLVLIKEYSIFFFTCPHKRGEEIRTSDFRFIKCSFNRLNYFLGTRNIAFRIREIDGILILYRREFLSDRHG